MQAEIICLMGTQTVMAMDLTQNGIGQKDVFHLVRRLQQHLATTSVLDQQQQQQLVMSLVGMKYRILCPQSIPRTIPHRKIT